MSEPALCRPRLDANGFMFGLCPSCAAEECAHHHGQPECAVAGCSCEGAGPATPCTSATPVTSTGPSAPNRAGDRHRPRHRGTMHSFCATCGDRQDPCAHDRATEGLSESERAILHAGVCPRHRDTVPGVYVCRPCETAGDEAVQRIFAARAAQPDPLRAKLAALADEWDARLHREFPNLDPEQYTHSHSRDLRALLADGDQ